MERPPRPRQDMYVRPWGLGHRGPVRPLTIARTNMLPSTSEKASATQTIKFSVLNVPGHTHRYRRFAPTLTGDRARLAEICAWFQLHTTGLSPAISCQLALPCPQISDLTL